MYAYTGELGTELSYPSVLVVGYGGYDDPVESSGFTAFLGTNRARAGNILPALYAMPIDMNPVDPGLIFTSEPGTIDSLPEGTMPGLLGSAPNIVELTGSLSGIGTIRCDINVHYSLRNTLIGVGRLTSNLRINRYFDQTIVGSGVVRGDLSFFNSDSFDCYMPTYGVEQNICTLYLHNIQTSIGSSGIIDLYSNGIYKHNNYCNINLLAPSLYVTSNNIGLHINGCGSDTTSYLASLDLFANADPFDNSVNLFLGGSQDLASVFDSLYLYLKIDDQPIFIDDPIPSETSIYNYTTLFLQGLGEADGYYPYNSDLNLYIQRETWLEEQLSIYIKVAEGLADSIDIYTYGVSGVINNSVDLFMPTIGIGNRALDMFIRGYRNY